MRKVAILASLACIGIAVAVLALPAQAAVTVNDSTDIETVAWVQCANGGAGELVDLSGPLLTLISYTINGNNVSGMYHFQPQGISGVGLDTGDKYQGTGVTKSSFKNSMSNGQANQTFVNNFRMIGQGSGNNFLVHENLHITVNAHGEVTIIHDNFITDCK